MYTNFGTMPFNFLKLNSKLKLATHEGGEEKFPKSFGGDWNVTKNNTKKPAKSFYKRPTEFSTIQKLTKTNYIFNWCLTS